ncbi:MAG: hypothetical protein QOI55_2351 [Actinomycetota bacterium]|nr:hypothetical protein [Actinomycetota bacterium]
MGSVGELFGKRGFDNGLLAGLVAFAVVPIVYATVRRRPATVAGAVFAVAGAAAIGGFGSFDAAGPFPGRVVVGMALLGAGGLAIRWFRPPLIASVVVLVPGAVVIAYGTGLGTPAYPSWVQPLIAIGCAAGGACAADVDYAQRARALGPVLLGVSVGAVYSTVPDTERAMVLVGAAIVLLLATFPTPLSSLGPEGATASTGLLLWVAAADGRGRPGSIVGAVGALGLLVAEPISRRLFRASAPRSTSRRSVPENHLLMIVVVGLVQAGIALYAARVAGFEHDGGRAALMLIPAAVVALLVATGMPAPRSRAPAMHSRGRHRRSPRSGRSSGSRDPGRSAR